jgi:hypothetical protein
VTDDTGAGANTVALARSALADARVDLDDAVSSLSDTKDETVMATSNLVDLLLRVVAARHHLEDVERRPNAGPPASLR